MTTLFDGYWGEYYTRQEWVPGIPIYRNPDDTTDGMVTRQMFEFFPVDECRAHTMRWYDGMLFGDDGTGYINPQPGPWKWLQPGERVTWS